MIRIGMEEESWSTGRVRVEDDILTTGQKSRKCTDC